MMHENIKNESRYLFVLREFVPSVILLSPMVASMRAGSYVSPSEVTRVEAYCIITWYTGVRLTPDRPQSMYSLNTQLTTVYMLLLSDFIGS